MKECFLVTGPESCGNRLLAAQVARCGFAGGGTTDQTLDILGQDKVVIIRHHLNQDIFRMIRNHGYKLTVLVTARDIFCASESRKAQNFNLEEQDYSYKKLFLSIPDGIETIVVPYEALVLHGADKLVERLGLKYETDAISIDNHIAPSIHDGNAKYYGKVKPEDDAFKGDSLIWLPEKGMGYYPVKDQPYDGDYFDKYIEYSQTEMGQAITEARVDFVNKNYLGPLVDVGIGSGAFIAQRGSTCGFDVNPVAVDWLRSKGLLADPRYSEFPAATFWDSLEHINNPMQILQYITTYVFVSMPIYDGPDHILRSKHFRKDEHCLYFTKDGFINWMSGKGFDLLEVDDFESRLGREDILSFSFRRRPEEQPNE